MGKHLGIPGEYFALANDELVFRIVADLSDAAVFRRDGEWIDFTADEMVEATIIRVESSAVDVFDQFERAGRAGHLSQYPISPGQTRFWELGQDPRDTDAFTTGDLAIAVAAAIGGPQAPRQPGASWGREVLEALSSALKAPSHLDTYFETRALISAVECLASPVSPFYQWQDTGGSKSISLIMERYAPVFTKIEDDRNEALRDLIRDLQDRIGRALEGVTWAQLEQMGASRRC